VVLNRQGVAIFVDGDFWRGCPEHTPTPKATTTPWREKLRTNTTRDRDTNVQLVAVG
jgi:DNA mismatch endonuclease (patch repair protein)